MRVALASPQFASAIVSIRLAIEHRTVYRYQRRISHIEIALAEKVTPNGKGNLVQTVGADAAAKPAKKAAKKAPAKKSAAKKAPAKKQAAKKPAKKK